MTGKAHKRSSSMMACRMANVYDLRGRVALVTGGASGIGAATAERLRASGAEVAIFDVNCAGVGGQSLRTVDVTDEEWEHVMGVNANGTFYACRAVIPGMVGRGYGRIVLVASIAGKEGNPMAGAYSASKAAVIGMTKAIGKDVAGTGVLVNCIAPAVIETPILAGLSKHHIDYMVARIPLGRVGEAAEVAALIAWLASEDLSFSTGAT